MIGTMRDARPTLHTPRLELDRDEIFFITSVVPTHANRVTSMAGLNGTPLDSYCYLVG